METNFDRDFRAIVAAMVSAGMDEDRIIEKAADLAGEMENRRIKRQQADIQRAALNANMYSGSFGMNHQNNARGGFNQLD